MSDLVKIARARVTDIQQTHWEGCERDHRECLIQRMADEIERLTAERDELRLQLAEAEQDARRYRYLRDQQAGEVDDYGTVGIKFRCDFEHYRDLDAAIDAAMGLTRPAEES